MIKFVQKQSRLWQCRTVCAALGLSLAFGFNGGATAADSDAEQLASLSASVQAAEAIRAVKRLQNSYGHYVSDGLWNDLADLFTADAVGVFPAGAGVGAINGQRALHDYFMQQAGRNELGLAKGQLNVHLQLQPIITLGADGVSAKGTWHEVSLLGHFRQEANWEGGIYENEYRLDSGVWKISKVGYYHQYAGAYADYGHKAPAAWGIPYHFDGAHVGLTIPTTALQVLAKQSKSVLEQELSIRIQRLQDETAVQNLQHSFGYYLDRKLWDDVADLFTAAGTLELDQRGVYRGADHIKKALVDFYGASPLQNGELFDHIVLGTVVTVAADGKTANARSNQINQLGRNGEYARWEEGTYENTFVKEGRVWKLQAVHYYPRVITDYDLGWAQDAQPAPAQSATVAPDAPSSQVYASYPELVYVGLHYANPVTGKAAQYPAGTVIATIPGGSAAAAQSNNKVALAELARSINAVIAVDAVENLNSSYGYYIDESNWDGMASTFSLVAGAKELTGAGVYVGQERIRKVLNLRGPQGGRSANFFTIHQLVQPVIHVADDGLHAKARLRLYQSGGNADGSSGSWIGGIYENTAVFENGEWKFGIQDLHHLFNASYRNGWARFGVAARPAASAITSTAATSEASGRAVLGGGIQQGLGGARGPGSFVTEMPPDRKIRSRQYAFPEITEPAFHYRNPVSGRMPLELLP
jgi:hypothetical protein